MDMKTRYRWFFASLAISSLIVVSIRYIDRPLARLTAEFHLFQALLNRAPVELPAMIALACLAVLLGGSYLAAGKRLPKWLVAGMLAGFALLWSLCLTEFLLKPLFGRTLPTAYLQNGQYGFHWFHLGNAFGSFPSGHADQATAILSVLWVFYPRWRWGYAGALVLGAFALVLGEWHFLSDIIAGSFIGTVSGVLMMQIWKAVEAQNQGPRSSVEE
jgi:membrane-associated phospholipid phosphatase